jgi:hypothetical protein
MHLDEQHVAVFEPLSLGLNEMFVSDVLPEA